MEHNWIGIWQATDPPYDIRLVRRNYETWQTEPVSVETAGDSLIIVPRSYWPDDRIQPVGRILKLGVYRLIVVNSNFDVAECRLIHRGQALRVFFFRVSTRWDNFKRRVSITRDIWRNRL